jgi:hypothetical protein
MNRLSQKYVGDLKTLQLIGFASFSPHNAAAFPIIQSVLHKKKAMDTISSILMQRLRELMASISGADKHTITNTTELVCNETQKKLNMFPLNVRFSFSTGTWVISR